MMVPVDKSPELLEFEAYIDALQLEVTNAISELEGNPFEFKDWKRDEGGGGRMATLRGDIIEKGAVHVSKVEGASNPLTGNPFRAAGLSLILHPANPHAPTVHMNVRRFEEATDAWWGGGIDLTPMGVWHESDVNQFHDVLRRHLGDKYGVGKAAADTYFDVPHRGRTRGAGGVFYDHLRGPHDAALVQDIGNSFLTAYLPLLTHRSKTPVAEAERSKQLRDRGLYVEFNLLYDRGTRFGLESGGNVEAILSSLPPLVSW